MPRVSLWLLRQGSARPLTAMSGTIDFRQNINPTVSPIFLGKRWDYLICLGELLCQKRSTGTFLRVNLFGSVKRGNVVKQASPRSPSKCFRISHPLLRSFEIKGDFALCGGRRGAPPLDPATFEKVDETFTVEFICATFFVMLLFLQAERCSLRFQKAPFFYLTLFRSVSFPLLTASA